MPSYNILRHGSLSLAALFLGTVLSASEARPASSSAGAIDASTVVAVVPEGGKLSANEKHHVVEGVVSNLKEHYVDHEMAEKIAASLGAHEAHGDDDAASDGTAFAGLITRQIRETSHDLHLSVDYFESGLRQQRAPDAAAQARYRRVLLQENCSFEEVKILPHNIGYLKLNSFPDPSVCAKTARSAMASLNSADAVIFDLRDNRGGMPGMVMLLAGYLFDQPQYLYNPREDSPERTWTLSPVPGNKLADKPVYVLTSNRTYSGAEHFSYDLKMLKRASLVGERTAGAADVGVFHRIDDHFGIGIRESKALNPYPEPDWAVTGIQPNVSVNEADALLTAERLAEERLQKRDRTPK